MHHRSSAAGADLATCLLAQRTDPTEEEGGGWQVSEQNVQTGAGTYEARQS